MTVPGEAFGTADPLRISYPADQAEVDEGTKLGWENAEQTEVKRAKKGATSGFVLPPISHGNPAGALRRGFCIAQCAIGHCANVSVSRVGWLFRCRSLLIFASSDPSGRRSGTRFWPRSRRARAKQVLALDGERSMIQQTLERLKPIAGLDKTWIITNEYLAQEVADQLPGLPRRQIVEEPCARNTAPRRVDWPLS